MSTNRILDSSNATLGVSNLAGGPNPTQVFTGVPIGAASDSTTGELGVKVHVISSVAPGGGGSEITPTMTLVTTSGSVAAGSRALTFVFSADYTGTVLGASIDGASTSSFNFPIPSGYTLGEVEYTVSTGNILIYQAA